MGLDDPQDGRSALLSITPKGRSTLAEVRAAKEALLRGRIARLAASDRSTLARALPVLASLLEDDTK